MKYKKFHAGGGTSGLMPWWYEFLDNNNKRVPLYNYVSGVELFRKGNNIVHHMIDNLLGPEGIAWLWGTSALGGSGVKTQAQYMFQNAFDAFDGDMRIATMMALFMPEGTPHEQANVMIDYVKENGLDQFFFNNLAHKSLGKLND